MKKNILIGITVLISSASYAQNQGQVVLGGGLGYTLHSDLGTIGFGGSAEYWVTDIVGISGQFHKYTKDSQPYSLTELDLRYYLVDTGAGVYMSAGYTIMSSSFVDGGNGVNVGAGLIIPVSCSMGIGAEVKYTMIDVMTESVVKKMGLGLNMGIVFRL